jgi:hypothetical protein
VCWGDKLVVDAIFDVLKEEPVGKQMVREKTPP